MAAYLLFIDGAMPADTGTLLGKYDLAEVQREAAALTWLYCQAGPGGKPGMLGFWMDHTLLRSHSYQPDTQKWIAVPHALGGVWLGTYADDPLRPSDLLRSKPYERCLPCRLEDGNDWLVPIASWLPHVWGQDSTGAFTRKPADRFASYCQSAEAVFQFFAGAVGSDQPKFEIDCQWSFICEALSLNYRLCPAVVSALGLIGDNSGPRVLAATVEMVLTRDVEDQKKS